RAEESCSDSGDDCDSPEVTPRQGTPRKTALWESLMFEWNYTCVAELPHSQCPAMAALSIFHQSFRDWLKSTNSDYALDVKMGHRSLAALALLQCFAETNRQETQSTFLTQIAHWLNVSKDDRLHVALPINKDLMLQDPFPHLRQSVTPAAVERQLLL